MRQKHIISLGWIWLTTTTLLGQPNHTITIDGLNAGWAAAETFTNISSGATAYLTWDTAYFYFAIAHPDADNHSNLTHMYFDTDPMGTNGSSNAYAYSNNITVPFMADFGIFWRTHTYTGNYTHIEVVMWSPWSNSWITLAMTSGGDSTLYIDGIPVVSFARGTDYREVRVKRSLLNNPSSFQFCSFTEYQWGPNFRYLAFPGEGWTDATSAPGQSIPHAYGYFFIPDITPNASVYFDAIFNAFVGPTSSWSNPTNWSRNEVPTSDHLVYIPYNQDVKIGQLDQANAWDILVEGSLKIKSDSSGTGSLIFNNPHVPAIIERFISAPENWPNNGHFISSPVEMQSLSSFETTGLNNDFNIYGWDENTGSWISYKDPGFVIWNEGNFFREGCGYLIAYQNDQNQVFTGPIHVKDVVLSQLSFSPSQGEGWHLLGNPFSSALAWNNGNWNLNNVAGIAKVWNPLYQSYHDVFIGEIIPSAQGFMVQVNIPNNSITIPSQARVHSNLNILKASKGLFCKIIARPVNSNATQEFFMRLETGATPNYDFYWDSQFIEGLAPHLYAICDNQKLSTFTTHSIAPNSEIPLGFKKIAANDYTLQLVENNLPLLISLLDLKTNQTQNLSLNPVYSFSAQDNDPENRFILRFEAPIGINAIKNQIQDLYVRDHMLYLANLTEKSIVEIFGLEGTLLFRCSSSSNKIPLNLATGTYLLRISSNNNQAFKLIFIP